jgi:hypothetical protein
MDIFPSSYFLKKKNSFSRYISVQLKKIPHSGQTCIPPWCLVAKTTAGYEPTSFSVFSLIHTLQEKSIVDVCYDCGVHVLLALLLLLSLERERD